MVFTIQQFFSFQMTRNILSMQTHAHGSLEQLYSSLPKLEKNEPTCPLVGERTNIYIYTHNKMVLNHEKSWRKPQCLLLSERTNLRSIPTVSPTTWHFTKGRLREQWNNQNFFLEWRWWRDKQAEHALCVTLQCPYILVRSHRTHNTKREAPYKLSALCDDDISMWAHQL